MILDTVIQGLTNIVWILMLLCVVMYIYAVFGVVFFGENDPRNFRDLGTAFKNVISMTTMADWMDFCTSAIIATTHVGYRGSPLSYYPPKPSTKSLGISLRHHAHNHLREHHDESLHRGVITNRMEEATLKLKETKEEKSVEERGGANRCYMGGTGRLPYPRQGVPQSLDATPELTFWSFEEKVKSYQFRNYPRGEHFQLSVRRLVVHPIFEWLIVSVILAAAITSGVNSEGSKNAAKYSDLQDAFLLLFAVELGVGFFAHLDKNFSFFTGKDKWWNIFDTIVVAVGLVPSNLNQAATVIRLIRLLRDSAIGARHQTAAGCRALLLQGSQVNHLRRGVHGNCLLCIRRRCSAIIQRKRPVSFPVFIQRDGHSVPGFFLEEWRPVFDISYNGCNINRYGKADGGAYYAERSQMKPSTCVHNPVDRRYSPSSSSYRTFSFPHGARLRLCRYRRDRHAKRKQTGSRRLAARERILSRFQHYFSLTMNL